MNVLKPHISVKAMCIIVHRGRLLAQQCYDKVKDQSFLRLLGGTVEFGEASDDALRRELKEEIGSGVSSLSLRTVIENTFMFEGQPGHEIVFVYEGKLDREDIYTRETIPFVEAGSKEAAVWTSISSIVARSVRLYPDADYAALLGDGGMRG